MLIEQSTNWAHAAFRRHKQLIQTENNIIRYALFTILTCLVQIQSGEIKAVTICSSSILSFSLITPFLILSFPKSPCNLILV